MRCRFCKKSYKTQSAYDKHMQENHVQCPICAAWCKNGLGLKKHDEKMHPYTLDTNPLTPGSGAWCHDIVLCMLLDPDLPAKFDYKCPKCGHVHHFDTLPDKAHQIYAPTRIKFRCHSCTRLIGWKNQLEFLNWLKSQQ